MVNILISGAHGFIGSHIVKRLKDDGVDVLSLERRLLYRPTDLKLVFDNYKPSLILHLAAYGNLVSQQDQSKTIEANIIALHNMLEASKDVLYQKFINFSSSSTLLPQVTYYSATKRAGELICQAFSSQYNKQIVSVLPYTVIGTGEPKQHLIPVLIDSCLKGTPMRFVGEPTHDFIGIDDFIDALKLITEKFYISGSVEIGTGVKTTNEAILKIVEEITGNKANITRVDSMRSYDSRDWVANNKIIKSLGWTQKQSIQSVVKFMVSEQFRKNN